MPSSLGYATLTYCKAGSYELWQSEHSDSNQDLQRTAKTEINLTFRCIQLHYYPLSKITALSRQSFRFELNHALRIHQDNVFHAQKNRTLYLICTYHTTNYGLVVCHAEILPTTQYKYKSVFFISLVPHFVCYRASEFLSIN